MFSRMCEDKRIPADILTQVIEHPFNKELDEGTLSTVKFYYYMQQDIPYLLDYAKVLAILAEKLTRNGYQTYAELFIRFRNEFLEFEKLLRVEYIKKDNILKFFPPAADKIEKQAAISEYTKHLLESVNNPDLAVAVASMLPCFWLYKELGERMQNKDSNHPYKDWIASYTCQEFVSSAGSIIEVMNTLGKEENMDAIVTAFVTSINCEMKFWTEAYEYNHGVDLAVNGATNHGIRIAANTR